MKLKQILTAALSAVILLPVCAATAANGAENQLVYHLNDLAVSSGRTKEPIGQKYGEVFSQAPTYNPQIRSTWYSVNCSLENPYESGVLTDDTRKVMLGMTNYYRWLVGTTAYDHSADHSDDLQAGALVRNFHFAHSVDDSYKPEDSWNFELGTHLNLFGGSTHFDLALYYMKIHNQQLSIMEPNSNYGRMMVNAGKSHSYGLETTLRGKAIDNALDWGVTYSFTNAKFDDYDDYKDNYVPFVPQHAFSAMLDYHIGKFTIGTNLNGQGKIWWDEANTYAQKFYALLGAHADYDFGPVIVTLWGRNLTNTHYNTFAVQSSAAGGTRYFAQRANPIQVGVDVNIHF